MKEAAALPTESDRRRVRRRRWIFVAVALVLVASLVTLRALGNDDDEGDAAPVAEAAPLERIAFGSCLHQDKEQAILDAVLAWQPELFVFLGDNVYADVVEPGPLREAWQAMERSEQVQALREAVPVLATWDDHDFGTNDLGGDHPHKEASAAIFLEHFPRVAESIAAEKRPPEAQGIYSAHVFGPEGRRVQVLLLDTRYHRSPLLKRDADEVPPHSGPYRPFPEAWDGYTMLGDAQWTWLEARLAEPAEVRLIGSSIQVVGEGGGWEGWANMPAERARLLELIEGRNGGVAAILSGDMHWAELSRVGDGVFDLTSSGLTEAWTDLSPNRHRVGEAYTKVNFGTVEIEWPSARGAAPRLTLAIHAADGEVVLEQTLEP